MAIDPVQILIFVRYGESILHNVRKALHFSAPISPLAASVWWARRAHHTRINGFGFWVLGFGFWVLGFGFWVLGFWGLVGFGFWVLGFGFWVLGFRFSLFAFHPPHPPPSSGGWSGDFGEHCLSTWPRSGSCEFRSRLTSRATQGTPQGWRIGVAFSLVTFFWRSKRKTSRRAAPGNSLLPSAPIPRKLPRHPPTAQAARQRPLQGGIAHRVGHALLPAVMLQPVCRSLSAMR